MRALVSDYLNHKISRRGFVNRLAALGFTAASAEAMLAPLDASEGVGTDQPGMGYNFEGTGAAAGRVFNSSSATNALRLRPAETASTPMPM